MKHSDWHNWSHTTRETLREILGIGAARIVLRELSELELSLGKYSKYSIVNEPTELLERLSHSYEKSNPWEAEVLLRKMSPQFRAGKEYANLLVEKMTEVYSSQHSRESISYGKIGVVQKMACYAEDKTRRELTLENMIAQKMGDGSSQDFSFRICETTSCQWVVTSYLNAQDAEGYRIPDPLCPVHGDTYFTPSDRLSIWKEWKQEMAREIVIVDTHQILLTERKCLEDNNA